MTTILEALQNAQYNYKQKNALSQALAEDQLNNAIVLLEKGYYTSTEIDPLLDEYDNIESVPENF